MRPSPPEADPAPGAHGPAAGAKRTGRTAWRTWSWARVRAEIFWAWQRLGIANKFALVFSVLLSLALLSILMDLAALFKVQNAESEIHTTMEIRQKIFEMDGELEKARRLYWDLLANNQDKGFETAQEHFGKQALEALARVIAANEELKSLIAAQGADNALRRHGTEINLYLSLTQRFSDNLRYNIELLTALAAPDTGLETKLGRTMNAILDLVAPQRDLLSLALNAKMHEMNYRVSRQRPFMQAALNDLDKLRRGLSSAARLDQQARQRLAAMLIEYETLVAQILSTDVTLRSLRNDFSLQVQTLTPISQELKALAEAEVARSREKVASIVGLATAVVLVTTLVCSLGAFAAFRFVRRSVTQKLLSLTQCASRLRSGNLDVTVAVDSIDELGVLADAFNAMTHRIRDLVENLEDNVRLRTYELSLKNRELDEKNKALAILSHTDGLTGLCNRRKTEEALRTELRRIKRYAGVFSLILADLDHFKKINDTYGHAEGDGVLIRVADILTSLGRETDIVGRWGGEEFLIVCPETDNPAAQRLAERLRLEIAETVFAKGQSMTASFGVATATTDDTVSTIVHRADEALYLAKNNGRNRVESRMSSG